MWETMINVQDCKFVKMKMIIFQIGILAPSRYEVRIINMHWLSWLLCIRYDTGCPVCLKANGHSTKILSSNSEVGTAQSGVTCSVSSLSYYTELGKNWFRRKAEEAFLLWFSLIFSKMISG